MLREKVSMETVVSNEGIFWEGKVLLPRKNFSALIIVGLFKSQAFMPVYV